MEYFFAAQIRQYRLQLIRAFSNFSVSMGANEDGTPKLKRVPCRYGDSTRIAETILVGNSENRAPSAPFISVYVTNMALAPERRAAPSLVSTVNVNERAYDGEKYLNNVGNRYTVKRYMPVPFTMTANVDIWTSSLNQKEELFEQTQVLFNGMVDIQTSNNPLDWTLFSTIEPTNITWSSRTIPMGTENAIDVFTVEYRIPIWINPPAQLTYQRAIEQIVANINTGTVDETSMEWTTSDLLERRIITPDQAGIQLRLIDDHVYEISLTDAGGGDIDREQRSTVIQGRTPINLEVGASFSIQGKSITIPNSNITDLLNLMRNVLQGTNTTVTVNQQNQMVLTNTAGGNIELKNIVGTPVESLGFVAVTYPGGKLAWWRLLEQYGSLRSSVCEGMPGTLSFLTSNDLDARSNDIKGMFQLHPIDQNLLIWTSNPDSWPSQTLDMIDAVINPHTAWPGQGLPPAAPGQRYLIVEDMASNSVAWGEVEAQADDIIQFDGVTWVTNFDSATSEPQLVKNRFSRKYYKFDQQGWREWPLEARAGGWRLKL
jgi:hypothetical protein